MDQLKTMFNKEINPSNWSPASITTDLSSKVIIVTGGNAGIGYQTILALSQHAPKRIFLTARSKAKFDSALTKLREHVPDADKFVSFIQMDLESLGSVKQAASAILAATDRLDILFNNAGIMGAPPRLTQDGYECHFATNHLGHALLTKLLLPLLEKTAKQGSDVRIINVSSTAQMSTTNFDPASVITDMSNTHMLNRYGQSKLANTLHARELARKYPSITSVSVHPGRVGTGILDDMFAKGHGGFFAYFQNFYDWLVTPLSEEHGAFTQLWCATAPKDQLENGGYYVPVGKFNEGTKPSKDEALARKLWDWQEGEFTKFGV